MYQVQAGWMLEVIRFESEPRRDARITNALGALTDLIGVEPFFRIFSSEQGQC
jgi:hypothetical protein